MKRVRTVLVTGGNRGIGLEVCRQLGARGLKVLLGSRSLTDGENAALSLCEQGMDVKAVPLDVGSDDSVADCARIVDEMGMHVDVLVNNGGVLKKGRVVTADWNDWRACIEVNFVGALRTCRAFVPGMLKRGYGRVVNVSSGYGSFGEGLEGPAPYSVTKAALDALTKKLADDVDGDIKVNAVGPGWVRTRMGGDGASRSVEKGAETIVWLATLDADGPNGGFFRDKREVPW
jgi:NAD(P)-dependent dehydrogenase (short-subunit alcohol dehydrogenase family)